MSQHNDIETPNSFESDASLRMALRGLPREIEPANDLWPGIAARIQAAPAQAEVRKPARQPWAWPVAMAASLLVATGLAWQVRPSHPQAVAASPVSADVPETTNIPASGTASEGPQPVG